MPTQTYKFSQYLMVPTDTVAVQSVVDTDFTQHVCLDSVFAQYSDLPQLTRESLFGATVERSDNPQPVMRTGDGTGGWLFALLFTLLAVLSIYLNSHRFKIKDVMSSLFSMRNLDRMYRESNMRPGTFALTTTLYMASLSLLVLNGIKYFGVAFSGLHESVDYLIIFASLILFVGLKSLVIKLFGNLFEDKNATSLYLSSNSLFYFVGTLVLMPMLLLLFYIPDGGAVMRNILFGTILLLFVIRLFRGLQLILTNSQTSKLYLFYYLCIFEIVPILIAVKALFL